MRLNALVATAKVPAFWGTVALSRDVEAFARTGFLRVAVRSGLLDALAGGDVSGSDLAARLEAVNTDLLDALLQLGVELGELGERSGRYRLRGRRAKALVSSDALQALVLEVSEYHGSVYQHLPERIRGAPLGDYLPGTATLVARSSRLAEPFVAAFVRHLVGERRPGSLLEIGCGSGVYMRHALESDPDLTAVGIDMQPEVVAMATSNLGSWGLGGRATIRTADVRSLTDGFDGPFDLITLYNNIYYFPTAQRTDLFSDLARRLAPGGAIALVSMMGRGSISSADLDLTVRSTIGCGPLPRLDELPGQLRKAGLTKIEQTRLIPPEPLYGMVAS